MLNHPLWVDEPFDRGKAFWDLVARANWKDGFERPAGRRVDVGRGQLCASVKSLCGRWGWSRGKVQRFLDDLVDDNRIVIQNYYVTSLLTILNYDQYQSDDNSDGKSNGKSNGKPNSKPEPQKTLVVNENEAPKKDKNIKNKYYSCAFEEFWSGYPARDGVRSGKKKAWESWCKQGCEIEAEEVVAGVATLARTDQWTRDNGRYIPMASTLLNQRAWEVEIPEAPKSFLDKMLDVKRADILKGILTGQHPDLLEFLDKYTSGAKPIPPKIKSYIEEIYHAR